MKLKKKYRQMYMSMKKLLCVLFCVKNTDISYQNSFVSNFIKRKKNVYLIHICFVFCKCPRFNPLPDDKIIDWSKLKQTADEIAV